MKDEFPFVASCIKGKHRKNGMGLLFHALTRPSVSFFVCTSSSSSSSTAQFLH